MSNTAINWAYEQICPSSGAKFVLVALADFADERNSCFPSQSSLAQMTGQGIRTVSRHLEALEALDLVTRHARYKNGARSSDRYVLNIRKPNTDTSAADTPAPDQPDGNQHPNTPVDSVDNTVDTVPAKLADTDSTTDSDLRKQGEDGEVVANLAGTGESEVHTSQKRHQYRPNSTFIPAKLAEEPSVNPQLTKPPIVPQGDDTDPTDSFEAFWAAYPRKVGPLAAAKIWRKVIETASPALIVAGARRLAADPNLPALRFVPHPTTWLRRGGWEEGPLPPRDDIQPALSAEAQRIQEWRARNRVPVPDELYQPDAAGRVNPKRVAAWSDHFLQAVVRDPEDEEAAAEYANQQLQIGA